MKGRARPSRLKLFADVILEHRPRRWKKSIFSSVPRSFLSLSIWMSSPLAASCFLPFASFFSTLYCFLYPLQTSRNGEQLHTISNWCGKADLMTISLLSLSLPPTHFPEVFLARARFLHTRLPRSFRFKNMLKLEKLTKQKRKKKLFHRRRVLVAVGEWIYLRALQVFHPKISFTFFSICEWDASPECRDASVDVAAFHTDVAVRPHEKHWGMVFSRGGSEGVKYDRQKCFDILWLFSMENSFPHKFAILIVRKRFFLSSTSVNAESRNRGRVGGSK